MPSPEHTDVFNASVDRTGDAGGLTEPENLRQHLPPFAQPSVDSVQQSQNSLRVPPEGVGSYTEQPPSVFFNNPNPIKAGRRAMWQETGSIPPLAGGQDKGKSKNLPDESGAQQGMQFPRNLPDKEAEALLAKVDWELLETGHAGHARQQLMEVVKKLRPDWDDKTVAQRAFQVELDYKDERYLELKEKKGESDRYVTVLKEEIDFWQTLLGKKDGV